MKTTTTTLVAILLCACSPSDSGSPSADGGSDSVDTLVSGEVSPTNGAIIFHDGAPDLALSIPPSAVAADTTVTIGTAKAPPQARSPVIVIEPQSTTLAFPASIAIAVEQPTPGLVIARITEQGYERLPGSGIDPATGEVHGVLDRFGRFVVVDPNMTTVADAPTASTLDWAQPVGTGIDVDLVGEWHGIGPHADFDLSFTDQQFVISRAGARVREGAYALAGNRITLDDTSGGREEGTVTLTGDELLLATAQSGDVRWSRAVPEAPVAGQTGFFAVAPPTSPATGAAPAKAAPHTARSTTAAATVPAAEAPPPEKKKGFFSRLGSGIKNAGKGLVQGVKNIGKSTADQTVATVEQTAANSEAAMMATVDGSQQAMTGAVAQASARAVGTVDDAGRRVAGALGGVGCERILGDWAWSIGGQVGFANGGRVRWNPGSAAIPPAVGSWTCVPETGVYTVTWQNGFVDTLRVSADGSQVSGISSTGAQVSGHRSGAYTGGPSGAAGGTAQPGADGWVPIGDSGFGRQTTLPVGPGGVPQRIGPQGRPPPKGSG
jgi:hypothetical protein